MKILVIQPRMGIGDMVLFLSYIRAIAEKEKFPVSILVKKSSRATDFLKNDKHIDRIITLDRKRRSGIHDGIFGFFNLIKTLKKENFEKVYIFSSSLRYALIANFSGIKKIYQYSLFKKQGQNIVTTAKKFTEQILSTQVSTEPKLYLDQKLINEVKKQYSFSEEFKHICIGLSASGPTKRWDIEKFIATFTKISKEIPCKFYLAGGKNDLPLIEKFKNTSLGKDSISFENMTINETLPIIANCDLYVGNDTGWLHLSAALNLTSIALFMDSPVMAYGKYSGNIKVIVPTGETEVTTTHNTRGKDKINIEEVFIAIKNNLIN